MITVTFIKAKSLHIPRHKVCEPVEDKLMVIFLVLFELEFQLLLKGLLRDEEHVIAVLGIE